MQRATHTWVSHNLDPDWNAVPARPSWEEIHPNVLMLAGGSNAYVVRGSEGLLLIDPGHPRLHTAYLDAIERWSSLPVIAVGYTHGHADHIGDLRAFLDAGHEPEVIAQENVVRRIDRYEAMHGFNQHINRRQTGKRELAFATGFSRPTLTYRDQLAKTIGGVRVMFQAAMGETDDYGTIWLPDLRMLFVGDLATWKIPNSGNPLKVQRYPIEWMQALRSLAAIDADWLCPGHDVVLHGRVHVRKMLEDHARYLESIIIQVRERLNAGESYDEVLHGVGPDPELTQLPYLRDVYNHPQFIVRDLLRYWGGWWDGRGSELLPAPFKQQATEVAELAGGVDVLLRRAMRHEELEDLRIACHLIDWAALADPSDVEVQQARARIYRMRADREPSGMAYGIFLSEAQDAEAVYRNPDVQGAQR